MFCMFIAPTRPQGRIFTTVIFIWSELCVISHFQNLRDEAIATRGDPERGGGGGGEDGNSDSETSSSRGGGGGYRCGGRTRSRSRGGNGGEINVSNILMFRTEALNQCDSVEQRIRPKRPFIINFDPASSQTVLRYTS